MKVSKTIGKSNSRFILETPVFLFDLHIFMIQGGLESALAQGFM